MTACLVCLALYVDLYLLPSSRYIRDKMRQLHWQPLDLTFFEGLLLISGGVYFLAGRGGINIYTANTVIRFYIRKALYGTDMPDVSEVYRHDLWQPKASVKAGLAMILAGGVLIVIYFASLMYAF